MLGYFGFIDSTIYRNSIRKKIQVGSMRLDKEERRKQ
jgi:hypothetical protein